MAIELPDEVVSFLSFIGINWPTVNEDKVREFASHVREFASSLEETHHASSGLVQRIGESYQGASYDALVAKWDQLTSSHMNEMVQACHVVATALDAAADVIVAMKIETIGELVVMAAAFIADQAAAVATLGAAEAAVVAIEMAARKLVNYLEQQLEQYIIGQVVEAAIDPLVEIVSKAVSGLVFEAAGAALDAAVGGGSGSGSGFRIHPEELEAHAQAMHEHAETVAGHVESFRSKVSSVSFA